MKREKRYLYILCFITIFNKLYSQYDNNIKILNKRLVLGREIMKAKTFSMVFDGYEQPFRDQPYLINVKNRNSLLLNYDTIYVIGINEELRYNLLKRNILLKSNMELDSLLTLKNIFDNISIKVPNSYKKSVKKQVKKYGVEFNGFFDYSLYDLKIKYIYGGIAEILVPNIGGNRKKLMKSINCHIIYIIDILPNP